MTTPLSSRVYATYDQYVTFPPIDRVTPPDMVDDYLALASEAIDLAVIAAVYDTDDNSMPTDPTVIDVFARATCAQAQFMIGLLDPAGIKGRYTSRSAAGVSTSAAPGTTGLPFVPLGPRTLMILQTSGALPSAALIGW
jgi:hypothetical protein